MAKAWLRTASPTALFQYTHKIGSGWQQPKTLKLVLKLETNNNRILQLLNFDQFDQSNGAHIHDRFHDSA